jgi:hypothetical protein
MACYQARHFWLLRPNRRKAEIALVNIAVQVVEVSAARFVLIELGLVLVGGKK